MSGHPAGRGGSGATEPDGFDAVVLAGGTGRRLGGVAKPALRVGDATMLEVVLAAAAAARRRVVVGPRRATASAVTWTHEQPPGGGPVAAIAAALPLVDAPVVAVLAADLPFLDAGTVVALVAAVDAGADGAVLVDDAGREQLLVGAWRTSSLRRAVSGVTSAGCPVGRLVAGLSRRAVHRPAGGGPPRWWDCDTAGDLARAREWR